MNIDQPELHAAQSVAAPLETRVAQLEQVVLLLGQQLQHAQRAIWLMHQLPPCGGRLPVLKIPHGAKIPMQIPSGFDVLMLEGQKVSGVVVSGNGHG